MCCDASPTTIAFPADLSGHVGRGIVGAATGRAEAVVGAESADAEECIVRPTTIAMVTARTATAATAGHAYPCTSDLDVRPRLRFLATDIISLSTVPQTRYAATRPWRPARRRYTCLGAGAARYGIESLTVTSTSMGLPTWGKARCVQAGLGHTLHPAPIGTIRRSSARSTPVE